MKPGFRPAAIHSIERTNAMMESAHGNSAENLILADSDGFELVSSDVILLFVFLRSTRSKFLKIRVVASKWVGL